MNYIFRTRTLRFIILIAALITAQGCSKRLTGGLPVETNAPAQINPDPHDPKIPPDQLITAFHQGARGNCAVIAVIKEALGIFGAGKVVTVDRADPTKITLQDGQQVILADADRIALKDKDGFVKGTDDGIYEQARFLYDVIVKRKFDLHASDYKTIAAAADALNGGEGQTAKFIVPLLGLTAEADIDLGQMADKNLLIVTSNYHAAFSSKGYYDEYGQKTLISDFKANHHVFNPFKSSDLSEAYSISEASKIYPHNFDNN